MFRSVLLPATLALNRASVSLSASLPSTSTLKPCIYRSKKPQILPHTRYFTHSSPPPKGNCSSCGSPYPTTLPVCPNCDHIERLPDSLSYYQILGLEYKPNPFVMKPAVLKRHFLLSQNLVHPDRWSGKPPQKQRLASELSTAVNTAYTSLLNPVTRALHILKCEGIIESPSEETLEDPALIMEVMEAREALEEAQSQEEVEQLRGENQEKCEELMSELSQLVASKDWPAVRTAAIKLNYLHGIEKAAKEWPALSHNH